MGDQGGRSAGLRLGTVGGGGKFSNGGMTCTEYVTRSPWRGDWEALGRAGPQAAGTKGGTEAWSRDPAEGWWAEGGQDRGDRPALGSPSLGLVSGGVQGL